MQARIALTVYMFVASAEAAFCLIPTQASYWMIAGIALGAGKSASGLNVRSAETESVAPQDVHPTSGPPAPWNRRDSGSRSKRSA